ncbi:MAG: DMT family transporter [Neptuniibacter sp.]|jgi:quaternary ammonium compound-resistance protein SugE
MGWFYLCFAGILECFWAIGLKQSEGFTKLWPSVISAGLIVLSLTLLSMAMKTIPVGTAYAVWAGIGAALLAIYGILFMDESASLIRISCIFFIVFGVAGLKYFA